MELEKLEELLALLQAYGATAYTDDKVQLNLIHLDRSQMVNWEESEDDFGIQLEDLEVVDKTNN